MAELTVPVAADVTRVVLDIARGVSPPPGESADGTTVPPATSILYAGQTFTITSGKQAAVDGKPVANTSNVSVLKLCLHPVNSALQPGVYQANTAGAWYGPVTPASGGPAVPGDPSQATPVPPVPTPGVPKAAAEAGYNTQTFGAELVMGSNWHLFDHYGNQNPGCVTQLPNGAIRCNGNGSNGFNAHVCSARAAPGSPNWRGVSFGGGAYFEATLKWDNAYQQVNGWPSWWGNECSRDGYGMRQWPGQRGGYKDAIELDFMEWWSGTRFGGAIHRWYEQSRDFAEGCSVDVAAGAAGSPHRYGFLWVPSTTSARGYARVYFDDAVRYSWSWPRYNPAAGPPPTDLSTCDVTHQALILGTSAGNPMTVTAASVWQANTNQNIVIP